MVHLGSLHPAELVVVNAVANMPLVYCAFWLASWSQTQAQLGRMAPFRRLLVQLAAGTIWGITLILDRIAGATMSGVADVGSYIASKPVAIAIPIGVVMGLCFVSNRFVRGGVAFAIALFYLPLVDQVLAHPGFAERSAWVQSAMTVQVLAGATMLGLAAFLMTIPSHTGRWVAALLGVWGIKLLGTTSLSILEPGLDFYSAMSGAVTPVLLASIAVYAVASGVVCLAEARRMRSSEYRAELLRSSEERLRTLTEASHEGLVIHRNGVVIDANPRFRTMTDRADLVGSAVTLPLPRIADAVGDGAQIELLRADGTRLPVEAITRALNDGRLVSAVRDLSERERDQARIRHLASHDGLTGLANRRHFDSALDRGMDRVAAGACKLAVLMIDLDRFKPVNDLHGHAAGDHTLQVLATRFERCLRSNGDFIARIGGDEFAALVWIADQAEACALAERLRACATEPIAFEGLTIELGASIGVACGPADGATGDELRHAADLALYAAKNAGRDRVFVFEPSMAQEAEARMALESDLRRALSRHEMVLFYQVQHELQGNTVVGYEALMRWDHPTRGLIAPCDFIPLAEETGLIVELGRWALMQAATDFLDVDEAVRVSVNVSPVQFERSDIVADVRSALELSGLPPERLEIEVTEQILIEDTAATLATLEELRALGVQLSLDDFGSGYSSLGYLTRFPFTKIKIDRCFVQRMLEDERSGSLVASILALASSLGLKVTAEGVETHGQLLSLTKGACDEAQGYLLGRPVPLHETGLRCEGTPGAREKDRWGLVG